MATVDEDYEDSIHSEDHEGTNVDIGLVNENEKNEKSRLFLNSSPFYPCKLGGKPQWLDYRNLKHLHESLICKNCNNRLSFLLQIYAPLHEKNPEEDPAFHRYLYLFICSSSSCSSKTIKAYRSQMRRKNEIYSDIALPFEDTMDFMDKIEDEPIMNLKVKYHLFDFYKKYFQANSSRLCNICGYLSTKMCSKCKFIYYCSESHQKLDWITYKHKNVCQKYCSAESIEAKVKVFIENELDKEISNENTIFPEYEILIEEESIAADVNDLDQEKIEEQLKLNEHLSKDLEDMPENEHDREFEVFKKRISSEPKQIIRYDRNGKPLWSTNKSKLDIDDHEIPKCDNCGSKRIFEFQVMPQLLTYLKLNEDLNSQNTIDWASLYIYTCENNCSSSSANETSYLNEFVYKQDF